jgi:hypothetical protein
MLDLSDVSRRLVSPGKGILAADESNASADKRLASYGIGTGEEMHRKFRDLFLNTPGIEEYLSGVILYKETLGQKAESGEPFPELLRLKGIIPGIKVDEAASLGGTLSVLAETAMPVSYVSEGQRVPEDLRPARSLELVSRAVQLAKATGAAADEDLLRRRYGEVAHALA